MDAFTVAAELIPGIALDAGQLAQLRAINYRHYTRLFALTRTPAADAASTPPPRRPTEREASELRAILVEDILALLTPAQRRALAGSSG
jgi:hypothetical protein